jgi:hypothetical protein
LENCINNLTLLGLTLLNPRENKKRKTFKHDTEKRKRQTNVNDRKEEKIQ